MKITLNASAKFVIKISDDEIDVLLICSDHHYDGVCNAAGRPGSEGFITKWKKMKKTYEDLGIEIDLAATFRDLDCSCKILEVSAMCERSGLISKEQQLISLSLQSKMTRAMQRANQEVAPISINIE